jgi:hypothetical protein
MGMISKGTKEHQAIDSMRSPKGPTGQVHGVLPFSLLFHCRICRSFMSKRFSCDLREEP